MVRQSAPHGKLVAATIALLENRQHQRTPDNVESSMDESTIKCTSNSSTDSGKDDNSISTGSSGSTSSNSDKECAPEVVEVTSVGCGEDFCWMAGRESEGHHQHAGGRMTPRWRRRERSEGRRDGGCCGPAVLGKARRCSSGGSSPERTAMLGPCSGGCGRRRGRRRAERDQKAQSCLWTGGTTGPNHHQHCWQPCHHFYVPPPPPCDCAYTRIVQHKPTSELEEQVRRLDNEKESLALQVAVLTDQVEAQAEKIAELEKLVAEQKRQISASDDMLQREMLTRSSLETQKLELLAVVSELKRREASLERDNLELREERRRTNKPPLAPRPHPSPAATSTPQPGLVNRTPGSATPSPVGGSPRRADDGTPTGLGGGQYRSLPRERSLTTGGRRVVAFADMERHERTGGGSSTGTSNDYTARSSSVPNLAETESIATNDSIMAESIDRQVSPSSSSAAKGIRKIFGRLKRSGSGNLDDLPSGGEGNFVRGGIRSTAGPRLCTTSQISVRSEIDSTPFPDWTVDRVCDWLRDLGLECCVTQEARNWIKSGSTLLSAPPHEVDKELNVKAGILRKKLHLALHCQRGEVCDPLLMASCRLDHCWVVRWLDDIGLPQYKNSFLGARLDGRMLHRLTVDDVHSLHVTSALHVASIRTGIHVLRKENFDPNCLIRRSDPDSCGGRGSGTDVEGSEERVELWTNHRVMEWLRVVDLAEYAPNLRGSGVHGGLMVHEDRFNATLLASLLSIPPEKTLLRRHLSTHFTQLVGPAVIQSKRLAETSLGYIPLTTSLKIKVPKKGQFTLKRKKNRFELDDGELVCPLVEGGASSPAASHIPEVTKSPRGCLS